MVAELVPIALGDGGLLLLNGGSNKLHHLSAQQADEMVMMPAVLKLVARSVSKWCLTMRPACSNWARTR